MSSDTLAALVGLVISVAVCVAIGVIRCRWDMSHDDADR